MMGDDLFAFVSGWSFRVRRGTHPGCRGLEARAFNMTCKAFQDQKLMLRHVLKAPDRCKHAPSVVRFSAQAGHVTEKRQREA